MADLLRENARHRPLTLTTTDGVVLDAALLSTARARETAVVVANGFTGSWRNPVNRRFALRMASAGDVLVFDFRGHRVSGGRCTVGDREVLDMEAAVSHLREAGYRRIATVGFSMGAAVAVRHAALDRDLAATVSVGGPSRWYYRGTFRMWLLHLGIERRVGRFFLRWFRKVRVIDEPWDPVPPDPTRSAGRIAPTALLVVHGDADAFFPVEHARRIHAAAAPPKELWIEAGMGHAERAMTPECADRIAAWVAARMSGTPQ